MNGKGIFRVALGILLTLAVIAIAAGIGFGGYRLGYTQGLTQEGKIVIAAPGGETPVEPGALAYRGWGYGWGFHRPFGFGFGFLGCLVPLLFFFLIFAVIRGLFFRRMMWGWGGGPWGHHGPMGGPGPHGEGLPPHWRDRAHTAFDEWHKQAHGEAPKTGGGESQSA